MYAAPIMVIYCETSTISGLGLFDNVVDPWWISVLRDLQWGWFSQVKAERYHV